MFSEIALKCLSFMWLTRNLKKNELCVNLVAAIVGDQGDYEFCTGGAAGYIDLKVGISLSYLNYLFSK